MDIREAKEILGRYQPGETTLGDPQLGEALEMARRDPQLGEWLAKHRAAQADNGGVATAAGPGQSAEAAKDDGEHLIPFNKPALIMIGLALAIVLAALLGPLLFGPKPKDPFTSYRDRMARLVQRAYPMKSAVTDQAQIREYFRTNGGPVDFPLPRNLEKLPGKGCAVFTWNSHPVALMGFDSGGTNMNLYLFITPRSTFGKVPITTHPDYARVGRLLTASWIVGNRIYVLAGTNDQAV